MLRCSVLGSVVTQLATLVRGAVMTQTHRGEAWSTSLPGHPYSCPLYHHRTEMEGESAQLLPGYLAVCWSAHLLTTTPACLPLLSGWTGNWRTLATCQQTTLGRGWSSTNQTLALLPQNRDGTDRETGADSHLLLSANGRSSTVPAVAVEGQVFFRDCDLEGRFFAVCQRDGSWVAALQSNGRWSSPELSPQPPTVCSQRTSPPPAPPPPPSIGAPPSASNAVAGGCPRGSYRSREQCADCPAGSYQPLDGFRGMGCTLCSAGRYRDHTLSASMCEICPSGRYGGELGAVACRSCPTGWQTPRPGGTGLMNCSIKTDPLSPPPTTMSVAAVPRGSPPPSAYSTAATDENSRSFGLALWSWFAWAGGASRELFLGLCIISCACIRCCARLFRKCKDRALGRGSGAGETRLLLTPVGVIPHRSDPRCHCCLDQVRCHAPTGGSSVRERRSDLRCSWLHKTMVNMSLQCLVVEPGDSTDTIVPVLTSLLVLRAWSRIGWKLLRHCSPHLSWTLLRDVVTQTRGR